MATFYPSLSNPRDIFPASYRRDQKLASNPEPPHLPNNMMYPNQPSNGSYSELFSGNSLSLHDCVRGPSVGARGEGEPVNVESTHGQLNEDSQMVSRTPVYVIDGEQNLMCQGLSLSLGTWLQSGVHTPSLQYQYTDPSASLMSSHFQAEDGCQNKESRNDEYLSYNLPGGTHNTIKVGALNNAYCSVGANEMHSSPHMYEPSNLVSTIFNSKYLKAAQQLLDEVVNVQKALKQSETDKHKKSDEFGLHGDNEIDMKMKGDSADPHESTTDHPPELSPSERQDLQNKLTKLLSMLDEVDRRYRQYYHQMQIVVSSFETVAGCGAAKPYTALALKTISRHFRGLRDAINGQIRATQKNLGEQDATPAGQGGLPRLRYVDQQLRQKRALQQFGVMQHSWRPQRGLPETSVSILRAWLFEHFLHPYPKDSEKIMLARQTGLTRGQVANWFINARVRLWKPMVEEMYKEEFGEVDSKSSPENASKAARDKSWPSEDMSEELQESTTTKAADGGQLGQFDDSKSDLIPDVGMQGCTARLGFQNGACGDNNIDCLQDDQRPNMDNHNLLPDGIISASASYNISELGNFSVGEHVSLALGLRHCENDSLSMSTAIQFRGDFTAASSVGYDTSVKPTTYDH